ncbi:hypothetical protein NC651_013038 [Populus alba x Populus x berolinensis]|nr:hypothetical protein NC651_013038 [Populus alba x Populus x berolinensis]
MQKTRARKQYSTYRGSSRAEGSEARATNETEYGTDVLSIPNPKYNRGDENGLGRGSPGLTLYRAWNQSRSPSPCKAHTQRGCDMPTTPSARRAPQHLYGLVFPYLSSTCSGSRACPEPNMLGSRQRAWIH